MLILKQLAKDYETTQIELARIMGVNQSEISKMMNGLREIKREHIELLEAHFGKDVVSHYIVDDAQYEAWRSRTARQIQGSIIPADIVEEIKEEGAEEANLVVPYVSKDLVQARDANIRELVLKKAPELKYKALSDVFGDVDYVQKVITTAMMPLFQPGDLLFIRFLPDHAKVISGAIYLIDTRLYGAMVRQVTVDGDTFRLTSRNPEYEQLEVQREDIYSVGIVAHMVRSDFNMPSEFPNTIQMMNNRDKQIDSLIAQIDKAGERENRLIKIIEKNNP
ncbi:MAG: helix-turn-helix domain-containing protein [Alistipes sp.]|nr:helix-turn-helix domain-containing protein [Alistipes sp.]MBR6631243.1 helix-turn-helix domain-containing protein [Alistipes sp.]